MRRSTGSGVVALFILGLALGSANSMADELVLKNGSRLIGTVKSAKDGKVVLQTDFAGDITVDGTAIMTLNTEDTVTLKLTDGRLIENQRIAARGQSVVAKSDSLDEVLFDIGDLDQINPEPWEMGRGYRWTGKSGMAMLVERGNTDSNQFDMDAASEWRSLKDRFSINASYEIDETDGTKNKDKWRLRNNYDYFLADKSNYMGALLAFEGDQFADLDLRTTVGPYFGRQFAVADVLSLRGELGLVYVDEQYEVADDNDYPGANWAIHLTSDYFGGDTTFYINHDGIINFNAADELVLNAVIGISMPIIGGLEAGAEARFKYDGGVGPELDDIDQTFKFRLGYSW